ncbi:MAG: 4-vinyl reductase [Syntrophaceae bacterium]|nr:4-vinyl reductase [Syntrophaceae bacterium]
MENVFLPTRKHSEFSWDMLTNIKEGRGDLGEEMPVMVYRLMQYTMLDVLSKKFGEEGANVFFQEAGFLAGTELARHALDLTLGLDDFLASLQDLLKNLKIGILRMEDFDPATGSIVLTVGQDLDCSGLPITDERVCTYDEGFIAGILKAYTGKDYKVLEVDCWASGNRTCRFEGRLK